MRTVILFGLAAGMIASAAVAEPLKLDDEQMEATTAGVLLGDVNVDVGFDLSNVTNIPTNVGVITSAAQAVNLFSKDPATAVIADSITQGNFIFPSFP
jgi:hypothetical protein